MKQGRHNAVYDAQDENLAVDRAATLLRTAAHVLQVQADALQGTPTRCAREAMRQILAGVVADCEVVRWALKE